MVVSSVFCCVAGGHSRALHSNSNSAIRFRSMGYAFYSFAPTFCLAYRLICVAHVSAAIAKNDPPMQYSLCIWGEAEVWTWGARVVRGVLARYSYVILNCADLGSFLAHVRRFEVRGIVVRQGSCRPRGDPASISAQRGSTSSR